MTAEERAEEYRRNITVDVINWGGVEPDERFYNEIKLKQAYLDGLKEGKPHWHKVADGDYPPYEKGNYSIDVMADYGNIVYYNYEEECWEELSSTEIDPPVAWCELPKYEE